MSTPIMRGNNTPSPPNLRSRCRKAALAVCAVVLIGIAWAAFGASKNHANQKEADESLKRPWSDPVSTVADLAPKSPERTVRIVDKVEDVPIEAAIGNKDRTDGQMAFAKLVADAGIRKPMVVVDGKEYPVPSSGTGEIDPREPVSGYKLEGNQFSTFTYKSMAIARSIEETLFAVNDANVYPGHVFPAFPYLHNGEVNDVNVSADLWAQVKVTMYGPALKTDETGKLLFQTPFSYGSAEDQADSKAAPGRRQQYELVRAQMIPAATQVGLWKEATETTFSKEHLELQASLRVNGGWGNVTSSASYDENQENSTVYMLLTQEAYRVIVDDADSAAGWIVGSPRREDLAALKKMESPLMYVSEVTYGRVILVTATSQLSSDELKIAISGSTKIWDTQIDAAARVDKERKLAATTFNILCWGGSGEPGESCWIDKYRDELTRLKTAQLTSATAMPIAFKACWLANKSPAAWVGVTPLRIYNVKREGMTYNVTLKHYHVKETHAWFLFFRKDGDMVVAARDNRPECKFNLYKASSGGDKDHDPNFPLVDPTLVSALEFKLAVRQGENSAINGWDTIQKHNHGAFKETHVDVNVQSVLDAPGRVVTKRCDFDDGNWVELLIRVTAPNQLPLKIPEMRKAEVKDVKKD